MSIHTYTEDQLVEQPAIQLFAELEWETVSAAEESFGPHLLLPRLLFGQVALAEFVNDTHTALL